MVDWMLALYSDDYSSVTSADIDNALSDDDNDNDNDDQRAAATTTSATAGHCFSMQPAAV